MPTHLCASGPSGSPGIHHVNIGWGSMYDLLSVLWLMIKDLINTKNDFHHN